MKTIVGVDLAGMYAPALNLCTDLDFPNQEIFFLHCVEPVPQYAPPMPETALNTGAWMKHLRQAGKDAIQKAEAIAGARNVPSQGIVVDGSPSANLLSFADQHGAELIAVGSARPDRISGIFFGSVARGLAIGAKQSLLVTKSDAQPAGPLKAIFATDHSEYANRCLEKLILWAPKGLVSIDIATTYEINHDAAKMLSRDLPDLGGNVEQIIEQHLSGRMEEVAQKLDSAGFSSRTFLRRGHPNKALSKIMEESGANLMIVGAQGHGFLERLLIGSVSLHQVVAEQYPVLLIRA